MNTFNKNLLRSLLLSTISLSLYAQSAQEIWFDTPAPLASTPPWGKGQPAVDMGSAHQNTEPFWENSTLPIGNGSIGANIFGSITTERFSFNEKTLWRGGPNTSKGAAYYWDVNKQSATVLQEIRNAFQQNDWQKAAILTQDNFNSGVPYEANAEDPFRFGSFTTGGEFRLLTDLNEKEVSQYRRTLSLDSALASVRFNIQGTSYRRDFFVSYPDQVMVVRLTASQKGRQNVSLSYTPNPLTSGHFVTSPEKNAVCYTSKLNNNGMKYVVRIEAVTHGGNVTTLPEGVLKIENADEVLFLITADTDYRPNFDPDFSDPKAYVGVNPLKTTEKWIKKARKKSYQQLLSRHVNDYTSLFNRSTLTLNPSVPSSQDSLPTQQRLIQYRQGKADYALESLYYQFGRYLLIASSRPGNMPANLQGIWHNNVDGPWRVDYHNNINIQMNYWPACPTNLSECQLPLIDFIRTLHKPGEKTAQAYFGARGWTASISANIFGFTTPLRDKDMSWNFSPVAGPWLATHIWDYYDYTRDLKFLKKTGYELIKSSANFAVDYLWKKPDGTYTAAPSTSPEHGPIDEGTTFSHAVIREILTDAIEASRILQTDEKERNEWTNVLQHLTPYRIGRYGQLMEWSKDIDDPNDQHRHVNHLFGLHPGHTISPVTTPDLARASRVVLNHRGDGATGWSMGWKLNQWARLHDGNHAYTLYQNLLKNGTNDNLWDSHPPFQIDGNFGGTAGVAEMLMQSHMGFIHLLPALPDAWKDGCIKGLKARGNFTVDIYWQQGQLSKVVIHSGSGTTCLLRYQNNQLNLPTKKGKTYTVSYTGKGLTLNP